MFKAYTYMYIIEFFLSDPIFKHYAQRLMHPAGTLDLYNVRAKK